MDNNWIVTVTNPAGDTQRVEIPDAQVRFVDGDNKTAIATWLAYCDIWMRLA